MSDQNRKRKQVTLFTFMKKIRKDEQQNTQEVKEDSWSPANGLPQHEKVLDDDIQVKMEVSENLRGHSDYGSLNLTEANKSEVNFRALVKFRVEAGDDVLEKHLKDSGRNTYISWRTQNEIISSINEIMLKDIVNRVNKNECFSIIADETTDIAGIH
ncbi:DUF4371 domain-containing protein [Trichonephila clavipes]|nr:DUF4371 domain-containing protein [Trichonephila clavipes]